MNFTHSRNSRRRRYLSLFLFFTFVYAEAQRVQTPFVPVTPPDRKHFLDWDPNNLSEDDEFYRSRIPLQPRVSSSVRANNTANNDRKMIWWCPIGDRNGADKLATQRYFYSLPRPTFEVDAFSMWQYLEAHGAWSAEQGILSGAMIDQAHRHGVKVLASVFVPWDFCMVRGGSDNVSDLWTKFAEKDSDGKFVYLDRMLDFFQHYGYDGMAFNQEGGCMEFYDGWADDIQDFFAELHKEAKKRGMDIVIVWYDFQNNEGKLSAGRIQLTVDDKTNSFYNNSDWFDKDGNTVTNAFFINYSFTTYGLRNSVNAAKGFGRSSYDVYAGMDLGAQEFNAKWRDIARYDVSFLWWGGHDYNGLYGNYIRRRNNNALVWKNDLQRQNVYQQKLEETFSGGKRNPANTPFINEKANFKTANTFHGVARLVTAKSTLNSLPFTTRFSLGNGQKFYDGGEVTHDNEWSNLGAQDYMPSWRWWISSSTNIKAAFTYEDAYSGGSCLRLSGEVSNTVADVHLYKTKFELSGNPSATVTFKLPGVEAGSDARLSLALAFSDDIRTFTYFDLGNVGELDGWTAATVDLSAYKGKTIEQVGLSVEAVPFSLWNNNTNNYKALIGELSITNGNVAVPDAPESFTYERVAAADGTMYHKMRWDLPSSPRFNGDVWYFDIIKEDREGNSKVVARTTNRGHYMVNFNVGQGEKVRVVSVAKDGRTKSGAVDITGNAAPVIADNLSFSIPENSANGTVAGIVQVSASEGDKLYYNLTEGNIDDAFAIDRTTGIITVNNAYALDFERIPVFTLVVEVSDQFLVTTKTVTVQLKDVLNDLVTNLALNKPARQSATYNRASIAVDGKKDGWRFNEASLTRGSRFIKESWWEVDLGVVSPSIEEVRIYSSLHKTFYSSLKDYYVFVSDVPFTGSSVAESKAQVGVSAYYQAKEVARPTFLPINRSGRYVRIQSGSKQGVALSEVEVMGTTSETATLPVSENSIETFYTATTFHTAAAGDRVTFSLGTSQDESFFKLNGGKLSFKNAPDYEMPHDKDKDNTYLLELKAADESGNDNSQVFKITVKNENDNAPVINSAAKASVVEGTTAVLTVKAADSDAGTKISYSVSGGTDRRKFRIDQNTGVLTFKNVPDFDSPVDKDKNNVYKIKVTASDGLNSVVQDIVVTVTKKNERLLKITTKNVVNVIENTTKVLKVKTADVDAGTRITYSVSGGADSSKFSIDQTTGVLAFKTVPDFENPVDQGDDNIYEAEVTVSDGIKHVAQLITITVTNMHEAPEIISADTANVAEGATTVLTVEASVDTGMKISYSISGGADSSRFIINQNTGVLTFKTAPDFETPGSTDGDNVYEVEVTVSDGIKSDSQAIEVSVTNENDNAPIILTSDAVSVADGTVTVLTVEVEDADKGIIHSFIIGGTDGSKFRQVDMVNTRTLTFETAPDFEMPNDENEDNKYVVNIGVTDGKNIVYQTITVTVINVNEHSPEIISANEVSIAENTTAVIMIRATDADVGGNITYSISGGADSSKFHIDQISGALVFKTDPDFEMPNSAARNNTYVIEVTASDGENDESQTITVTVTDVNEAPTITSSATADVEEGTTDVLTVTAVDPDTDAVITYSVSGGADSSKFSINPNTGILTFKDAPDFEMSGSANDDNVYEVEVTASDGENEVAQPITVTVTDVNEAPQITSPATANVPEGTTEVLTVTAIDPDTDAVITYSVSGGADRSKFMIDQNTGALTFKMTPDFEMPGSNARSNKYGVEVTASDGENEVAQPITVTVTDVNEVPTITSSATADVAEGTTDVLTVIAKDPDTDAMITYSVSGGADRSKLMIDQNTGALTFKTIPDFEMPNSAARNNTYVVEVTASDGENDESQAITVTVTNVNEHSPEIISANKVSIPEGTTVVLTVKATDADAGAVITYSVSGGADNSKFMIDQNTGALTFKTAPDFEMPRSANDDNQYEVEVTASDGLNSVKQDITITVTENNEPPRITSSNTASVLENTTKVLTVQAIDSDAGTRITYSISSGADDSKFMIDQNTGVLTFKTAPDFEMPNSAARDNTYVVGVTASDGENDVSQTITIIVTNVDEAPMITSAATASVAEGTTAVLTVEAADADVADADARIKYSISGGADNSKFMINQNTGALIFKATPDFEMPNSTDDDNVYIVEVMASNGLSSTQTVRVTVTNVYEAPVIISASKTSVAEGTVAVLLVEARVDASTTIAYSVSGGSDRSLFNINLTSGELTFKNAPDFEGSSADGDDEYEVEVSARDGTKSDMQILTVTVTDVNDNTPVITSAAMIDVAENTTSVLTVEATDADAGTAMIYSISGGADGGLFTIGKTSGALTFKIPPDFEMPSSANNDNEYIVEITVSDGTKSDTRTFTVTVTNVNEHTPVITSAATKSIAENTTNVLTVMATDADAGTVMIYSISSGADRGLFTIGGTSGVLTFKNPPDFEAPRDTNDDNVYEVEVMASDGDKSVMQTITITVTNVNDNNPVVTSPATVSVSEGTINVQTLTVTDIDGGSRFSFLPLRLSQDNAFRIDLHTGKVVFKDAPDFENPVDKDIDNVYSFDIVILEGSLRTLHTLTITVTDVNDNAPVITSAATASMAEGTTEVMTVAATDADAGSVITYSISGGADGALFTIGRTSGDLTFKNTPDFEGSSADGDDDYEVIVTASDGENDVAQLITITVTDVNEAPTITSSATVDVAEGTTEVMTVTATDADASTIMIYSISGGADGTLFDIGGTLGVLTFKNAPDFEVPNDANDDNVYEVEVMTSDGNNEVMQMITITVTDMNDNAPVITSAATASMAEGTTEVMTVTATDADASTIMIYSISGWADGTLFDIGGTLGVLTFKNAPDFEVPNDANDDNIYEVEVITSDGDNEVTQTITVTVTNDPADDVLGLPEGEGVRLYPNPASGHFILTGITEPLGKVILISTSGKVVKHYPASKDEIYDVSELSEGIFFVIIEVEGSQQQLGRIVIRK